MKSQQNIKIPTFDEMFNPTIEAIRQLGGSASIKEIFEKVIEIMELSDEVISVPHSETSNQSRVEYNLAWSRTYLKKYGILENSARGVWALTDNTDGITKVNPTEVVKSVREETARKSSLRIDKRITEEIEIDELEEADGWRDVLSEILHTMAPDAFERLTQRILRESGFVQVEVTGKAGDGGIDGKGIVQLNGIMSFHMMFQCKRYKNSISSNLIRDFRGALQGRAEKGLFITTSNFTRDAINEATRDGATPIDLIDGEELIDMLKDLSLGVKEVLKVDYEIDRKWYENI